MAAHVSSLSYVVIWQPTFGKEFAGPRRPDPRDRAIGRQSARQQGPQLRAVESAKRRPEYHCACVSTASSRLPEKCLELGLLTKH
jgi:hypothetical protein